MQIRKERIISFVAVIVIFLVVTLYKNYFKKDLLTEYNKTKGTLVNFFIVGVEDYRYLKYEYFVSGIKYSRQVSINTKEFDYCQNNVDSCLELEFWVIYSPKNPKESLINLKIEIQGIENPPFPKTLEDFE